MSESKPLTAAAPTASTTEPSSPAKEPLKKVKDEEGKEHARRSAPQFDEEDVIDSLEELSVSRFAERYKHRNRNAERLTGSRARALEHDRHDQRLALCERWRKQIDEEKAVEKGEVPAGKMGSDPSQLEAILALFNEAKHAEPMAALEVVIKVRKLLSKVNQPPIQEVIEAGFLPLLTTFLDLSDIPTLQFEAAWCLTNVASGDSHQTAAVVAVGAVPKFLNLMRLDRADLQEQAIWALGNIAGDSPRLRDDLLRQGALISLAELLHPERLARHPLSLLRQASWTLSNFTRGSPRPDRAATIQVLQPARLFLEGQDSECISNAMWCLAYFSEHYAQDVLDAGLFPLIIRHLESDDDQIANPALRAIGNAASGEEELTNAVLPALPALVKLLDRPNAKKTTRKEICWAVSNITAGTREQIQAVLDCNILPSIIRRLRRDEENVRKEAAWCVANVTAGGSLEQIMTMVQLEGCVEGIVEVLADFDKNINLQNVALTALEAFVKRAQECDRLDSVLERMCETRGYDQIAELVGSDNAEVAEHAQNILSIIGVEEDDE